MTPSIKPHTVAVPDPFFAIPLAVVCLVTCSRFGVCFVRAHCSTIFSRDGAPVRAATS